MAFMRLRDLVPKSGRFLVALLAFSIFGLLGFANAAAETGSRVGGSASPRHVIWLDTPGEFKQIRKLIDAGKKAEALELARIFVRDVSTAIPGNISNVHYFSLSVLCVTLTVNGEIAEAMETCDNAVSMSPGRWQAIMNRGTVYYVSDRMDAAIRDYRRALDLEADSGDVTLMIKHNLDLALSKQAKQ